MNPEAFAPAAAGRNGLQVAVLSRVMKVEGVGWATHGLKADEVASSGRIDDRNRILRSVQNRDLLLDSFDREIGTAAFAAYQAGEDIVKLRAGERDGIRKLHR